jgi:peptide/nickel transport system substrate-binding protein
MFNFAKSRFVVVLIGSFLLTIACGSGSPTAGTGNKTLIVDTSFTSSSLDPSDLVGQTDLFIDPQVYETLVRPDAALTPLLAQSYVRSPDGLSVTFNLRHDVHFSDGSPLTSADVVFSLMRLKYGKGTGKSYMSGLTATAPDPFTVLITSAAPNVFITSAFGYIGTGILNSKVVQANGGNDNPNSATTDTAEAFLNQQSEGSGPYQLVSIDPNVQIVLKATPNYWRSKSAPAYSKVIIRNDPASSQLLDVQRGQNTIALDLSNQLAASADSSKVSVITTGSLETFVLMLNANPAVSTTTSNLMIRQAVRYAIDYPALVRLAGLGAVQAQGLLPTGVPGALPANQLTTRDVAKATSLVAQSGIANPKITFEYVSDVTFYGLNSADIAQLIQSNLKDAGITVVLLPGTNATLRPRWVGNKMEMYIQPLGGNALDASAQKKECPGGSIAGWMGWKKGMYAPADAICGQILSNADPAQTTSLFLTQQGVENDFAVFLPTFRSPLVAVASKSVGGLNLDSLGVIQISQLT